jgi:hypothetical protein
VHQKGSIGWAVQQLISAGIKELTAMCRNGIRDLHERAAAATGRPAGRADVAGSRMWLILLPTWPWRPTR